MTLSDFGRTMRSCVDSAAEELASLVPIWTDSQRHDIERCLTVHLLAMHSRGMRECARRLRLDTRLSMDLRNRLADEIDRAIIERREYTP